MRHEKIKELISLYIEGELDNEERKIVKQHLRECSDCEREFEELNKLEEVMKKMEFKKPSKEIWGIYWSSVYNKLERQIGWILLSIGSIIIIFFGIYKLIEDLIHDPTVPLFLKIGILAFIGGLIILLISVLREQIFMRKRERYKEVRK
ncbi:MAG: anti-sigma factor family protein [Candidatus Aminicenantia bacterium]